MNVQRDDHDDDAGRDTKTKLVWKMMLTTMVESWE